MAYDIRWVATDDADWVAALKLFDNSTGQPLADAATASFELAVKDCDSTLLTASSDDLTITKPDDYTIRWRFTVAQLGSLCTGKTYKVGITMTADTDQVTQLVTGTLVFKDGGL